jgi:hypothetical protein
MSTRPRFTCSADGRHIYDEDFGFDARIDIDGDWATDKERLDYSAHVCKVLNADPPATADQVRK